MHCWKSLNVTISLSTVEKKKKDYFAGYFYIESLREYISIHTKTGTLTFKMPLSKIEASLHPGMFTRIHKSYIISRSKIEVKSANIIQINGKKLPVGRTYKPFLEL